VFVLDTNALLAAIFRPSQFGKKTSYIIRSSREICYSSLSAAELAIKHMLGKLKLKSPIHEILLGSEFQELSFDHKAIAELYSLPSLVRHEPFDRMIVATTRAYGARLITSDRQLLDLGFDWVLDSSE
jgi:PIN domain nuclease of toxin-antitoxin system